MSPGPGSDDRMSLGERNQQKVLLYLSLIKDTSRDNYIKIHEGFYKSALLFIPLDNDRMGSSLMTLPNNLRPLVKK